MNPRQAAQGMNPAEMANAQASEDMDGITAFSQEEVDQQNEIKLQKIYAALAAERDEWVTFRATSGIESEWRRAERLYEGQESDDDGTTSFESTLRNGPGPKNAASGARRSRVRINIVAPAVDNQVARVCEILLPVDDKNWGIRPTPNPSVADSLGDNRPVMDPSGAQLGTVSDIAKSQQQTAVTACKAMEREIDDQLTEARYNGECRKAIFTAAKLGTGILKGPFVVRVEERRWTTADDGQGGMSAQMAVKEKFVPSSKSVSLWNAFPDPSCGDDIQRGKGHYEMSMMTRKELRALAKRPGYDPDAIRKVLRQKPQLIKVQDGKLQKDDSKIDLYQCWEYHGEVDPQDIQMVKDRANKATDSSGQPIEQDDDPLTAYAGCLVMINDTVIAALPPMTADGSLPYDYFPWKVDDDSPFGHGVSIAKETQQRVVNSGWRMVMDNAGNASGPQWVINKSQVTPQNNVYEITANKIWIANENAIDVTKAFAAIQVDSRIKEMLELINASMQYADQESNTSPMMQGEQSQSAETLGGMTMRWTNANGVHRMRVKRWDDHITRPHLTRYYDWNMQNSEKNEIKGDFEIDARGSSTLIERDIQNQAMANVAAMFQNPVFAPMLKPEDALKATLKSWKLDPNDFMKTDEEIAQWKKDQAANPPQPDPATQAKLEITKMTLDDKEKQRQHELQVSGTHDQERDHQIAIQQSNMNARLAEQEKSDQTSLEIARINAEVRANAQVAVARQKSQDHALSIDSSHQMFNAEAAMRASTPAPVAHPPQ